MEPRRFWVRVLRHASAIILDQVFDEEAFPDVCALVTKAAGGIGDMMRAHQLGWNNDDALSTVWTVIDESKSLANQLADSAHLKPDWKAALSAVHACESGARLAVLSAGRDSYQKYGARVTELLDFDQLGAD